MELDYSAVKPIREVAAEVGLGADDVELYGNKACKISYPALNRLLADEGRPNGKIVLVTAITPTPAGEGKTTVTIGLAQALCKLGRRAIASIREPSMGPVFGMKGGATGGGRALVVPMEEINLHFTGDLHAISAAHNLLAAMLDNHLHQGNALGLDPRTVWFKRTEDMNDRALRQIVVGLGGRIGGVPREGGYLITAASEVMAILCLSRSLPDLKARLGRIIVGTTRTGEPITAADLKANNAMAAILRDALKPNLVQTLEGTPALVHGGPFGNIAHGCSSVLSARLARKLGEIVVTEAGFGSDLGFEKYCDIVAPSAGLAPDAVVLVATVRALKMHGGVSRKRLDTENVAAVERGLANLDRHAANVAQMGAPFVVAVNHFQGATAAETEAVTRHGEARGWRVAVCDVWGQGGAGGLELGEAVLGALQTPGRFAPNYPADAPLREKLRLVATRVYGGEGVELLAEAEADAAWLEAHGLDRLPVCMAKTQYSLSDDPTRRGAPTGFKIHVRSLRPSAGAGFIVALAGDIMTMPGLPEHPVAENIDVEADGRITGLF